jgi:hypothetical protein
MKVKSGVLTVNYNFDVDKRIKAAQESLPFHINIHECVIRAHDRDENGRSLFGEQRYAWGLFEFAKGTSRAQARAHILRTRFFIPANPAHMLAFAEQEFKNNKSFGEFHRYILGLGGELETVLGAQFGGLNFGMCYFMQHVPQNKWTHDGGKDNRFLGVRHIRK